jgi:regulator of RNase E activity RraA
MTAKDRVLKRDIPRPSRNIVESFLELRDMAGLVSRAMDRMGLVGSIPAHALMPIQPGKRIVGPAVTVRNVPARFAPFYAWDREMDSLLGEREAYFVAAEGDIVVIDSGGRMLSSNLGPNSVAMAKRRGIAGVIVDGPVTGVAGIRSEDFPVWCRGGTTVTGHHRVETIEINGVISCVGAQVAPGDLVVADDSGVSVVPCGLVEQVLEKSLGLARKGRVLAEAISRGAGASEVSEAFKNLTLHDPETS